MIKLYIYNFVCNALETAKFYIMLDKVLMTDRNSKKNFIPVLFLMSLYTFICCFLKSSVSGVILYILIYWISLNLLFRYNKKRMQIKIFWGMTFVTFIDYNNRYIIKILEKMLLHKEGLYLERLLGTIGTIMIIAMVSFCLRKISAQGLSDIDKTDYIIVGIIGFTDCAAGAFMSDVIEINAKLNVSRLIIFIIMMMGFTIELIIILFAAAYRNMYKERGEINQEYIRFQEYNFSILEKRDVETRKFRHDFRAHICILTDMCNKRKFLELANYIKDMGAEYDNIPKVIDVNNDIANSIFNYYYSECNKNNIDMQVEGFFSDDSNINSYDLCIILSNVMRNAYEEIHRIRTKSDKRSEFIKICIIPSGGKQLIIVENTTLMKESYVTNKKDKINHGYGLKNIADRVNQINGVYDISIDDNVFRIRLVL